MSQSLDPETCPFSQRKIHQPGESLTPAIEQVAGRWLIRDHDLVRQVLKDWAEHTKQNGFSARVVDRDSTGIRTPVLYLEGAEHREARKKIARFFAPNRVRTDYQDLMAARADALLARAAAGDEFDLDDLSLRMAVYVAAQVIGLTNSNVEAMTRRLERFFALPSARPGPTDDFWTRVRLRRRSLSALPLLLAFYVRDVRPAVRVRRTTPQEDVLSHLVQEGYRPTEILAECLTYAAAGMVTTREFIVVAAWHLLENADLRARYLGATVAEREQLLLELLRVEPVVGHIRRRTTAPITITRDGDTWQIPAGAEVDLLIRPANADPAAVGEHPQSVCPDRVRAPGVRPEAMAFGDGAHRCPGNHVAIQESEVFLTRLLRLPVAIVQQPRLSWLEPIASYELRGLRLRSTPQD